MTAQISSLFGKAVIASALAMAIAGALPGSAQARVFVGVGIPFPGYYPPPVYYPPPPVYYAPPPVIYAPPPQVYTPPPQVYAPPTAAGQTCYAEAYTCPMDRPVATGGSCYCLGNGGQRVWGRAN